MTIPPASIDCILPHELYIGNLQSALSPEIRRQHGITHVVSACLCSLVDLSSLTEEFKSARLSSRHLIIDVEDSEYEDILIHLPRACRFIEDALTKDGGKVLVHCVMGISRSVTVAAAFLMQRRRMSSTEAVKLIQASRSIAHPNYGFMKQLDVFESCEYKPTAKHPLYVQWRRVRKNDVTKFLAKFCDVATVLEDEGESLYLSSDFPTNGKHAEALILDLEITHLVHVAPSKIAKEALDIVHGDLRVDLNINDLDSLCAALGKAASFIKDAYRAQIRKEPKVFVHCDVEAKAASVAGAYLMSTRQMSSQSAISMLSTALGPLFEPTRNLRKQLEAFQETLQAGQERASGLPSQGARGILSRTDSELIESSIHSILGFREAQAAELGNETTDLDMDGFTETLKGLHVTRQREQKE